MRSAGRPVPAMGRSRWVPPSSSTARARSGVSTTTASLPASPDPRQILSRFQRLSSRGREAEFPVHRAPRLEIVPPSTARRFVFRYHRNDECVENRNAAPQFLHGSRYLMPASQPKRSAVQLVQQISGNFALRVAAHSRRKCDRHTCARKLPAQAPKSTLAGRRKTYDRFRLTKRRAHRPTRPLRHSFPLGNAKRVIITAAEYNS